MHNSYTYLHFNGALRATHEPLLLPYDLALLRGFGIFDYFLFHEQQPRFLSDYLDRFIGSAKKLGLALVYSKAELADFIHQLIRANGAANGGIRLLLTGGYAADSYTPQSPNFLIIQYPFPEIPERHFTAGIKLLTHCFQRELPEIKSINYLTGIRQQSRLRQAGADYLLYHDGTLVRESDRSNFFIVDTNGDLLTPATDILAGITRAKVLEIARAKGLSVREEDFGLTSVWSAREAFLTSTTKGVMPVVAIDDRPIGSGQPGAVSGLLQEAFCQLVSEG